jgi:hypothetical protein
MRAPQPLMATDNLPPIGAGAIREMILSPRRT